MARWAKMRNDRKYVNSRTVDAMVEKDYEDKMEAAPEHVGHGGCFFPHSLQSVYYIELWRRRAEQDKDRPNVSHHAASLGVSAH
jgi:hypothetical protein